jgi:hypothetical protein
MRNPSATSPPKTFQFLEGKRPEVVELLENLRHRRSGVRIDPEFLAFVFARLFRGQTQAATINY